MFGGGRKITSRKGAVLLIVLWVVILLSLILANFSFMVRVHTRIAENYVTENQLGNIASSGIEHFIAMLKQDTEPVDHLNEAWAGADELLREIEVSEGRFSIIRLDKDGDEFVPAYGAEDEAGKINLRTAPREVLEKLPNITPEMVSSLLDWQDQDSEPQNQGAEAEYYGSLPRPYPCRNAKLLTVEELLLVRGWTPEMLYGEDWNNNGFLDPNENDGDETEPIDDENGKLDRGLLPYITVYSADRNVTMLNESRVNIKEASEEDLKKGIPGLTDAEAKAIVSHRGSKQFENIGQLLLVEEPKAENAEDQGEENQRNQNGDQGQNQNQRRNQNRNQRRNQNRNANQEEQQNQQANQGSGKKVFDHQRLKQIIDYCAIVSEETVAGRVNINTAPEEVLRCLPGMTDGIAQAIVEKRRVEKTHFQTIADLLDVAGVTDEIFMELSENITIRSYQFKVASHGSIESLKVQKTIIAVVDRSADQVKMLYWNER